VGYEGKKLRVAVVRQKGKRKDFSLDMGAEEILLDGWEVPFRTDTEMDGIWAGNACYNLVGEPEAIRAAIEGRAVLPVTDQAKAKIVVNRSPRTRCDDEQQGLLFPDIDTHHAVVNRLKESKAISK
jgi:hypothetical protein